MQKGLAIQLQWNRYVHSAASLVALPGGLVLNTIRNPVSGVVVLQVVTDDCVVAAEIELDGLVIPTSSKGDLIAAWRDIDYPEVVVYRATVHSRREVSHLEDSRRPSTGTVVRSRLASR